MDPALNEISYGPPRIAAPGLVLIALVCAAVAVGVDASGRVLLGVAVVGALTAAGWLRGGPVLIADADGLRVRGLLGTHVVPRPAVQRILVDSRRRSRALEIETDDELLAVPALLLGRVSPNEAAAALTAMRGTAGP